VGFLNHVIKQDVVVCFLGQRLNFAFRLPTMGATFTANHYVALLEKLKQQLASKHSDRLSIGILFIKGNAAPHKAVITHQKLADLHFLVLKHPDLGPSVYCLFPNHRKHFKGRKFSIIEEATLAVDGWFAAQPK
jgi:hypothetical protein